MTYEQIITQLIIKPEHADEIKHLAHLKHLANVENMKQIRGYKGIVAKIVLRATKPKMDAILALAECESADDLVEFTKTDHFVKIREMELGIGSMEDLAQLEHLKELDALETM